MVAINKEEATLQDASQQIADDLEALMRTLIGDKSITSSVALELQVSTYKHGKGQAMNEGKPVTIVAHPLQILNAGDLVVGIPLSGKIYYVVGVL